MSELVLKAVDERGRPLSKEYLETLYFSTLDYEPFRNSILNVSVGEGCASFTPPSEPFQASMLMSVKGFGTVYVYADDEGEGFTGGEGEIDFVLEAARARLAKVRRWIGEQEPSGFAASSAVAEKLNEAERLLDEAKGAQTGSEKRSAAAVASLRDSLLAGEVVVFEKARQDVAKMGWREGFLFGAAMGRPPVARKDELYAGLLNYATVMLHWARFEPVQGQKDWQAKDELVTWLQQNRITAKGHPLLWLYPLGVPEWIWNAKPNYETLKVLVRGFANDIVTRYRDSIRIWDVINEAHDWGNIFGYSPEQILELTDLMCRTTREAQPDSIRVINSVLLWGQYVASERRNEQRRLLSTRLARPYSRRLMTPYAYLRRCVKANIDFEVIGVQLYNPPQDMLEISLMLDRFARFGKPVHVTEIGVSSLTIPPELDPKANDRMEEEYWCRFRNEWHGPWNEDVQTDWLEQFYTLCYSKPYITAVTNWELDDLHGGGLVHHSGFVRADLTPKKSYRRLENLIAQWNSMKPGNPGPPQ